MKFLGSSTCSQQATTDHNSDPSKFFPHIPALRLSKFSLTVVSHLRHDLRPFLLPSCFPTKLLHAVPFCLIHGTYTACPILRLIKNVKLCVSMPRRQSVGAEVKLHSFFTAVIDGSERPRLNPRRFNPGKTPQYPLCWQFDGPPQPICIFWRKESSLVAAGIQTSNHPAGGLVTAPTTLCWLRSLFDNLKNIWCRFHVRSSSLYGLPSLLVRPPCQIPNILLKDSSRAIANYSP
jgi:hypothetical protein